MFTKEQALTCNHFTVRITNPRNPHYGELRTCRRNGKTKTWKSAARSTHFQVPVKYGLYEYFYITHENAHEFEALLLC